jgi:hypothetical protein
MNSNELKDRTKKFALVKEAGELTAIFTASGKTAKQNNPKSPIRNPK